MEIPAGSHVLLGVCGGIGAYKAAIVARLLISAGATVDVVLTRGATHFVGAATFEGITGRDVRSEVWDGIASQTHVELGRNADAVAIYPATAHTIAKLANGLADDLLTTTLLAAHAPIALAPGMHTEMWEHPATRRNVATLRERGVTVVGPADGPLMGGDSGSGRVVEPDEIVAALARILAPAGKPLAGKRIVVTAGGTREAIDPVRFIGNRSSGRMGFALARAARDAGASVLLISAPSELMAPERVEHVRVVSALDMRDAVLQAAAGADVVIKAAAVADFRPAEMLDDKWKKEGGAPSIKLIANPDILRELADHRGGTGRPILVGFAAETSDVERNAREKLARKKVDLLVVNDVTQEGAGFEVDTNEVAFLDASGHWRPLPAASKDQIAREIVTEIARLINTPAATGS